MSSPLRRIAAAALAMPLAVGMATSADAKSTFQAKSSGNFASVFWEDAQSIGADQTLYTIGSIEARGDQQVDVFGWVDEITCPDPITPFDDEFGDCSYDSRWIFTDPGAVTLTLAKKKASAQLTGTVVLTDGMVDTAVALDVTLVGTGPTYRTSNSFSYRDSDGVSYSFRSQDTGRQATATGSIGDVIISGDSSGSFGTYRQMEREVLP
ncbi:hypothetical protein GA707_17865 [Nostocoides sp. F2B08]|uniref:hypothetical protein n=1 Tax=Nostocoides sp. F2B08 TaxID=2653936 RepID=UPI001262C597|nr:hypothetical protein [Tetrasphaera sp. F2B08]KAB7741414.1 hypothetical protein GA707_17865 [Tetrasphaera sp. F2B08]